MESGGGRSSYRDRLKAQIREPSKVWHYLPPVAGLCLAAFGLVSCRHSLLTDLTRESMKPSILAASALVGLLALGTLTVKPRRARFGAASSLLVVAASLLAFVPYHPILGSEYLQVAAHGNDGWALAERIVSVGKPAEEDETRLDTLLARYFSSITADECVPASAIGMSFWPQESEPAAVASPSEEATGFEPMGPPKRAKAFMLARNVSWYAPGDSIPLFVVCDYQKGTIMLDAWVRAKGKLGAGSIEGTEGVLPVIWAAKAGPSRAPREIYLRRDY
jgi:hypothetical protein